MKKSSKLLYVSVISLILVSCIGCYSDEINLGSGYQFVNHHWSYIIPESCYNQTAIYSRVTAYKFDSTYIVAKQIPDYLHYKVLIRSDLEVQYSIYSSYLKDSTSKTFYKETSPGIRNHIKADSELYKNFKYRGITNQNSEKDWKKIDSYLDSIFHRDPYYIKLFSAKENYWIINKKLKTRMGPLQKGEFNDLREKLGIKLNLED